MKTYNLLSHVNYTHFVGELISIRYVQRQDKAPYCLIKLEVQTVHKTKSHPPIIVDFIVWDRLCAALAESDVKQRDGNTPGDILNIEGRLTIRQDEKATYSITANKIAIVRSIPNKETFLQTIG